jgi:RNA polymerase sigma factor (sigma-70 family)
MQVFYKFSDASILARRGGGDREAAHALVTSHLRLVVKIAVAYRRYGLPISEVISEGNVGLMKALRRFEPENGFRLSTYARWWIKASIQEYILRSWSLVKMGTTAKQKKLFFHLLTKGLSVSYHRALAVAGRQSAKLFELRAARLWRDQGRRTEARDLLAPVYGWFTEGFDTPVLQEAKALLDELT